jgi:FlaA1/EpsC-like NDP-sugar epimerase
LGHRIDERDGDGIVAWPNAAFSAHRRGARHGDRRVTGRVATPRLIASVPTFTASIGIRFATVVRSLRGRHLLITDQLAVLASIYVALSLRSDAALDLPGVMIFMPIILIPFIVRPIVNLRLGLYRRAWVHASVPELMQVVAAAVVGSAVCLAIYFAASESPVQLGTAGLPRSFFIVEFILSLALIGGTRFLIRASNEIGTRTVVEGETVALTPALLFGAGRMGALMARSALREPKAGVLPVGFLDQDPSKRGASVAGLPVFGGMEQLSAAVRRTGAKMLLITMPNASGESVRGVMDQALEQGLTVRIVPPVYELLGGSRNATRLREVRIADLLTRHQTTEHAPGVGEAIRDQVVMITGAGGSIGSELARQVYGFGPRKLVLVDRAESPLYMIQRELELRALDGRGKGDLAIHLANVASRSVMTRLIEDTRPAVIFHAAACKHVPMMEEHPSEGVQVNVGGTMTVLSAAVDAGVPRFVLVSTDKAVEPSSVMGATKRLAEWLVADAAARTGRAYVAVRFGNVLGSAGSVLPIFQGQLENGEAITITHPEMSRYFMTIQEACWLILDATSIGRPGDLFVLDMGEPVKIVDMVNDLIRLAGRQAGSVPIRFTGLRPGEKLHEQLFYDSEKVEATGVDKILRVIDNSAPNDVEESARQLLKIALGDSDDELRAHLFEAVASARSIEAAPDGSIDDHDMVSIPITGTTVSDPSTVGAA